MKKNKIVGACSTHGSDKCRIQYVTRKNGKEHLADFGVGIRIILKAVLRKLGVRMLPYMGEDSSKWRAVVDVVMNIGVPQKADSFFDCPIDGCKDDAGR